MKIVFIVDSFPNVSETFIMRQMLGLIKAGHQVFIFAGSAADKSTLTLLKDHKTLLSKVRIFNKKPLNPLPRIIQALWMAPVFLLRAPRALFNSLNVFKYGAEAWSLNYYFQAFAFTEVRGDVTIAHFGPNGLVGARMKELGALPERLVCFFHAYDLTSYVARKGRDVYFALFCQCTNAVAISSRGREQLLELGCPPVKIARIHMGVDTAEYESALRNIDPLKPLRILSVARLVEKKGISFGIEAVHLLNSKGINAEYVVVGDGVLRAELEGLASRLKMQDRVIFHGARGTDFVEQEMEAADIFLLPSITAATGDEEGIPVVLMEALLNGIPVVACDSGAVKEIIIDGKTGILVSPKDPVAICAGLERLLQNPKATRAMACAGCQLVQEQFNSRTLNKELEHLIQT